MKFISTQQNHGNQHMRACDQDDSNDQSFFDNLISIARKMIVTQWAHLFIADEESLVLRASFGDGVGDQSFFQRLAEYLGNYRQNFVFEDLSRSSEWIKQSIQSSVYDIRFCAGFPVVSENNEILALLLLTDQNPLSLTDSKASLLKGIAEQLVPFLRLKRLVKQRQEYREQLHIRNQYISAIASIQEGFISGDSSYKVFGKLLAQLLSLTESEFGFVGEIKHEDDGKPYLLSHALSDISWNQQTRELYLAQAKKGFKFHNLDTLFGAVITTGRPVISNDCQNDPRSGGVPRGHPKLNAFLGLPLKRQGKLLGMLGIANRPGGYDADIVKALEPITTTCANLVSAHHAAREKTIAEEALRVSSRKLESANKQLRRSNEDLSQFAHIVSHDLQAPLRHIGTYADILESELSHGKSPAIEEAIEVISKSVLRMRNMINAILTYSKVTSDHSHKEKISLLKIIETAIENLDLTKADISLNIAADTEIKGDMALLVQVFQNLLQNAVKYQYPGRPLKLSISAENLGTHSCIHVADNGCGIEAHHQEMIFDMFKRLPAAVERATGAGIGLSICRKVIEMHGGKIWVESALNEGSVFSFTIPAADGS